MVLTLLFPSRSEDYEIQTKTRTQQGGGYDFLAKSRNKKRMSKSCGCVWLVNDKYRTRTRSQIERSLMSTYLLRCNRVSKSDSDPLPRYH